jgi:hypothetical protein
MSLDVERLWRWQGAQRAHTLKAWVWQGGSPVTATPIYHLMCCTVPKAGWCNGLQLFFIIKFKFIWSKSTWNFTEVKYILFVHCTDNLCAVGNTVNCSRKPHNSLFSSPLSTVFSTFTKLQKVLAFSCLSWVHMVQSGSHLTGFF